MLGEVAKQFEVLLRRCLILLGEFYFSQAPLFVSILNITNIIVIIVAVVITIAAMYMYNMRRCRLPERACDKAQTTNGTSKHFQDNNNELWDETPIT